MIKKVISILIALIFVVSIGHYVKSCIYPIPTPDKIILYNNGVKLEVDPHDNEYKKIVKLTNKSFNFKISVAKDYVTDDLVTEYKNNGLGIELLYNSEHKLYIWGEIRPTFKYYKLYFPLILKNHDLDTGGIFQHGDKNNYLEYSRGPLEISEELIDLVKSLVNSKK